MSVLLVITVLLPLIVGPLLMLTPDSPLARASARNTALAVTIVVMASASLFAWSFPAGQSGYQYASSLTWLSLGQGASVNLALGLDGISVWLFAMSPLLVLVAIWASWDHVETRAPVYYGLILALLGGLLIAFASMDMLLFYVFFEFTLIPTFFLIGLFGGSERKKASMFFFLYTLLGSLFTLIGMVALVTVLYQQSDNNLLTFSIPELTAGLAAISKGTWNMGEGSGVQTLVFLLLAAGFAVKLPLFPFHGWLPLTYHQAPTPITILLAGAMSKLGAYGLIRFNLQMTPAGAENCAQFMAILATITILYGALNALNQKKLKDLVAYSSLSHMGFIALGILVLNPTGLDGATIQMVNHGIGAAALFLLAGVVKSRFGTQEMEVLSGIWGKMPLLAFFAIVAVLGSAGVPGLNGFVGEFPILAGAFASNRWIGSFASFGMILGAYYLINMLRQSVFGPQSAKVSEASNAKLTRQEVIAFSVLTALTIILGVFPKPVLDRIRPATNPISSQAHYPGSVHTAKTIAPIALPSPSSSTAAAR